MENPKNTMTYWRLNAVIRGKNLKRIQLIRESAWICPSPMGKNPVPIRSVHIGRWFDFSDSERRNFIG
jgi:hypothetical protein